MRKIYLLFLMFLSSTIFGGYYDVQHQAIIKDTTTVRNDWYWRGSFWFGKSSWTVSANAIPLYIIIRDTGSIDLVGQIDGRDISVDGATLDSLKISTGINYQTINATYTYLYNQLVSSMVYLYGLQCSTWTSLNNKDILISQSTGYNYSQIQSSYSYLYLQIVSTNAYLIGQVNLLNGATIYIWQQVNSSYTYLYNQLASTNTYLISYVGLLNGATIYLWNQLNSSHTYLYSLINNTSNYLQIQVTNLSTKTSAYLQINGSNSMNGQFTTNSTGTIKGSQFSVGISTFEIVDGIVYFNNRMLSLYYSADIEYIMSNSGSGMKIGNVTNTGIDFITNNSARWSIASSGSNYALMPSGLYNLGTSGNLIGKIFVSTIAINGITYNYPIAQGGAGTYLGNDGSGNVSWTVAGGASGNFAYSTNTFQTIIDYTFSSDAANVVFSGLNGDTDEIYEIYVYLSSGANIVHSINMCPNSDTINGNYLGRTMNCYATTVAGSASSQAGIVVAYSDDARTDLTSFGHTTFYSRRGQHRVSISYIACNISITAIGNYYFYSLAWTNLADNITSLMFTSSDDTINKGTRIVISARR